jgi:hypothetical protein
MKAEMPIVAGLLLVGTELMGRVAVQGVEQAVVSTAVEWSMKKLSVIRNRFNTAAAVLRHRKALLGVILLAAAMSQLRLGAVEAADVSAQEPRSARGSSMPLRLEPGQQSFNLVAVTPVLAAGFAIGELSFYDDPSTRRAADYLELYNRDGDLVAVAWFDRFGIQRTAVDRAFLNEAGQHEGDFVIFVDGQSL